MYRQRLRSALLSALFTSLAGAAMLGSAQKQPQAAKTGVADTAARRTMSRLAIQATFHAQGHPDWMAVAPDAVWVTSSGANLVTELNPSTNQPGRTISVAKPCSGLAFAFGSLWIPSCGDHTLVRADTKTGRILARLAAGPFDSEGGITAGDGSVWLATGNRMLTRVDPQKNTVQATIPIPTGSSNPLFAEGFVWVSSHEHDALLKVDPASNKVVSTIAVGKGPRFLTAGAGSVWTLNQGDGTISRVDVKTGRMTATIQAGIPGEGGEIAFGFGQVWATLFGFPITRVDPATDHVVAQWAGPGGDSIRTGFGSLWLTNLRTGDIWRVAPEATR